MLYIEDRTSHIAGEVSARAMANLKLCALFLFKQPPPNPTSNIRPERCEMAGIDWSKYSLLFMTGPSSRDRPEMSASINAWS
jgi:hypothetical protein